ncbi:MarR family transcriptional regulator [Sphingomonas sp. So64.6b]|uniref:MarR family winged helix-turn-helix transcriptional regulator n=1 Tax=Sphingomonas sp. So64.6b TaxID=2997354 RepID=UPI0016003C6A|nr:MarR family transcriptional regulator [Sphingomonas sp. So64.6b]QNA85477.1 MarR family transcriptional regulator [Sphingomonas sp. So64.6b]
MTKRTDITETWGLFDRGHLPYRLLLLAKMIDRATARQVRDGAGLTLAEWRVLAHAVVLGDANASRIAAAAAVDRAEVSRALLSLEKAGLVTREADPNHGKRQQVNVSPEGLALHDRFRRERITFFDTITADLDDEELGALDGYLLRIARQTQAFDDE